MQLESRMICLECLPSLIFSTSLKIASVPSITYSSQNSTIKCLALPHRGKTILWLEIQATGLQKKCVSFIIILSGLDQALLETLGSNRTYHDLSLDSR